MFNLLSLVSWGFSSKKPSSNLELVSVPSEEEGHRTDQALKDAIDSSNCNGGNNNNVNAQVVPYPETSKDPEVTWALQVLDNLIALAKQCRTVSKSPNLETEAATVSPAKCKELQVEDSQQQQQQQQLGFKLLASSTCKTYTELPTLIMAPQHSPNGDSHEVRFADELYSLDDTDVELSPVEGDDDEEAFGYGKFAALNSKTDATVVDRVTGGKQQQEERINEASLTSLELPELETVFSESESSSDEDEGRLRHNQHLGQIVEEPETVVEDDDEEQERNSRPRDGGLSEVGSQPNEVMQGTQCIGQGEKSIKSSVALTSTTIRRVVDHEQAADINQTLQIQPLLPKRHEDNGRRKGSLTFDYLAPRVTVLDFQEEEEEEDEPSFRLWECESSSSPSRRRSSQPVSKDFQDPQYLQAASGLGGGSSAILESQKPPKGSRGSPFVWEENNHSTPNGYSSFDEIKKEFEQFPPQSVRQLEHRHRRFKDCSEGVKEAEEEEGGEGVGKEEEISCPSPSSFTYERSPTTSVVSDEQPPGQLAGSNSSSLFFQSGLGGAERFNPDLDAPRTVAFMYRESPASVLSQEPDEMPNSMSDDSSEPRNHQRPCSSTFIYRDESSDLESILEGFGINREKDEEEGHVEDSKPFELYWLRKKADAGRSETSVSELEKPFFSRFTYTAKAMLETSSEEDPFERHERSWLLRDTDLNSTPNSTPKSTPKSPLHTSPVSSAVPESSSDERWEEDEHKYVNHVVFEELRYFQEAEKWEPWLGKDDGDGVLDRTDLEFLFPPNFKYKDSLSSQEALEEIFNDTTDSSRQSIPQQHQHQQEATTTSTTTRKLDRHGHWVPYVTGRAIDESLGLDSPKGGSKRHTIPQVFSHISKGIEKLANHGSKRHTNSSPPDPSKVKSKDEDDNIFPSVRSWEVAGDEESGPRITSSLKKSSRRWRHPQQSSVAAATQQEPEKLASSRKFSSQARSASFVPSVSKRSRGVAHIAPCTGRLFSWPQRMRSFSNFHQKSRFMDSDDEGPIGERSFGMSARRDAQQMKRILKGSQKKYAEFSADDILKQDFG